RGNGKDVADVVEPVADVVGRKVIRGLEVDSHQVADGVVVFGTIETTDGHTAGVNDSFAIDLGQLRFQPVGDHIDFRLAGFGPPIRGHSPRAKVPDDSFPDLAMFQESAVILVDV